MLVAEHLPQARGEQVVPGLVGAGYRLAQALAQRVGGSEEAGGQGGAGVGRFDVREFSQVRGGDVRLAEGLGELEAALVKGAGGQVVAVGLADCGAVGQRVGLQPAVPDLLSQAQRLVLPCPAGGEVAGFGGG